MRRHILHIPLLFILVWSQQASAGTAFVVSEDKAPFCKQLLVRLNAGDKPSDAVQKLGAQTPEFASASITFQSSESSPVVTEAIDYASFDVDNDGSEEVLLKYITSIRGRYGDLLWIVRGGKKTINFSTTPRFSAKEFVNLEAIESVTPWPYASRGLFLVEIMPFRLDGVNYLSIKDTLFGNPLYLDRTWRIGKFTGRKLASGGFGHETDDFESLCAFNVRQ